MTAPSKPTLAEMIADIREADWSPRVNRLCDEAEALERENARLTAWGLDMQRNAQACEVKARQVIESDSNRALRAQVEALTSERDELRAQHHRQDCGDVVRALVERNAVLHAQVEAMRAVCEAAREIVSRELVSESDEKPLIDGCFCYSCRQVRLRDALARLDASGKGGAE